VYRSLMSMEDGENLVLFPEAGWGISASDLPDSCDAVDYAPSTDTGDDLQWAYRMARNYRQGSSSPSTGSHGADDGCFSGQHQAQSSQSLAYNNISIGPNSGVPPRFLHVCLPTRAEQPP